MADMVIRYFFEGMPGVSEPFGNGAEHGAAHDAEGDTGGAANAFGAVKAWFIGVPGKLPGKGKNGILQKTLDE